MTREEAEGYRCARSPWRLRKRAVPS